MKFNARIIFEFQFEIVRLQNAPISEHDGAALHPLNHPISSLRVCALY